MDKGYPQPAFRQVPVGAVAVYEQYSRDGVWIDLMAILPDDARIYVTTRLNK